MFEKLKHKRQKFSFTRLDDDVEILLRPIFLKIGEEAAFNLLKRELTKGNYIDSKYDEIHHEIFIKEEDCETTYCFTHYDKMNAIISVNTYASKSGISYNKLLNVLSKLKELFSNYLIKN